MKALPHSLCLYILTALIFSISLTLAEAQLGDIKTYFNKLTQEDSTVFAGAVATWRKGSGIDSSMSTALGNQTIVGTNISMTEGNSFRTNTLSEVFLDMTVAYLSETNVLPFTRTQVIPSEYLPAPYNGTVAFQNPLFPTAVVSLDTLLLHTSSFTEAGFDSGAVLIPGPAASLETFLENVFSGINSVNIWGAVQPGLSSSYRYSRMNTALITYILDKILSTSTTPMSVATFIQNTFISPAGLTGTFLLDTIGAFPTLTYPVSTTSSLSGRTVQDVTGDGSAVSTSFTIHAAYTSDYMYYTSVLDLAKLAYELFLGGRFTTIGDAMKNNSTITINSATTGGVPGVISRSLGVYGFNPTQLCNEISSDTFCEFNSDVQLFGWVVRGERNQILLLCESEACVVSELNYFPGSTVPLSYSIGLAMPSVMNLVGNQPRAPREGGRLYGFYVFLGVLATLIVVVAASFIADYVIQPAAGAAAISVPKVTLPRNGTGRGASVKSLYDQQQQQYQYENEESYGGEGVSPPVRRLDVYD